MSLCSMLHSNILEGLSRDNFLLLGQISGAKFSPTNPQHGYYCTFVGDIRILKMSSDACLSYVMKDAIYVPFKV